jgi:hypothetical protein
MLKPTAKACWVRSCSFLVSQVHSAPSQGKPMVRRISDCAMRYPRSVEIAETSTVPKYRRI